MTWNLPTRDNPTFITPLISKTWEATESVILMKDAVSSGRNSWIGVISTSSTREIVNDLAFRWKHSNSSITSDENTSASPKPVSWENGAVAQLTTCSSRSRTKKASFECFFLRIPGWLVKLNQDEAFVDGPCWLLGGLAPSTSDRASVALPPARDFKSVNSRSPSKWHCFPLALRYLTWNTSVRNLLQQLSTKCVWNACAPLTLSEVVKISAARSASPLATKSVNLLPSKVAPARPKSIVESFCEGDINFISSFNSTTASQVRFSNDEAAESWLALSWSRISSSTFCRMRWVVKQDTTNEKTTKAAFHTTNTGPICSCVLLPLGLLASEWSSPRQRTTTTSRIPACPAKTTTGFVAHVQTGRENRAKPRKRTTVRFAVATDQGVTSIAAVIW